MSYSQRLFKQLIILIFITAIKGKLPLVPFQMKTPTDLILREELINYITNKPGIDVITYNKDIIEIAVPKRFLGSFKNVGIAKNGTDLLEKILLRNFCYRCYDISSFENSKKNLNASKIGNGVKELMEKSNPYNIQMDFNRRYSYSKIVNYLRKLTIRHSQNVKLKRIGKTVGNRYIFFVILYDNEVTYNDAVFLHAGVQGNDWLSVMMVLYIIQELAENAHSHTDLQKLAWYIIPVVNPDGYQYSYIHPKKPWSKNRNCTKRCSTGECGVDLFRNFPWNFGERGSSKLPCSLFYAGPKPFSEVESRVLGQALIHNRNHLKLYIGIEGSGSSILYPWGYSYNRCDDHIELKTFALIMAKAMNTASHNSSIDYRIGSYGTTTCAVQLQHNFNFFTNINFLDPSAGNPLDYAKQHLHIKFSYILQMGGFHNNQEVLPVILQTFAGIKKMAFSVYAKYLPQKTHIRLLKRKRKHKHTAKNNTGCNTRTVYILITCHITSFVRWLYK